MSRLEATLLVGGFGILVIGILILITMRNERKKKMWLKDVDVGDTCRWHVPKSIEPHGKILKVSGDKYIVEFEIDKRWLYPPKNTP